MGAARLGDIFGKKPLYLGGLILFTASSLLCAWAPSIEILIFWVNLPIGIVASLVVNKYIPHTVTDPQERRFDLWGAVAISIVLVCFSLGMRDSPTVYR